MKSNSTTISALYVVNELIPKLNAVEKRVELTIGSATAREGVPMGI